MGKDQELVESLAAVRAAHFEADGLACDFAALGASAERRRLAAGLAELVSFDPKNVLIAAQTAFWINVFNAAVLRDAPELSQAASVPEVEGFFDRPRLKIGGLAYSLDDIEHGVLRGNVPKFGRPRSPMKRDDPRLAYMPLAFDERLHFAIFSGTRSSPAMRVFAGGRLDAQFEEATAAYLRRTVRIERNGALVVLPRQFYWYSKDFGGESAALEFVLARLDEELVEPVDRRRGAVKLHYDKYDWSINRR
jgi:hypothetical protein